MSQYCLHIPQLLSLCFILHNSLWLTVLLYGPVWSTSCTILYVWIHMEHRNSIWYWNICVFPLLILYHFHQGRKLYGVIIKYFHCNFMPLCMWSHCMCTAHSEYIYCIRHSGKSPNTEAYFLTLQDTHISWDALMQN